MDADIPAQLSAPLLVLSAVIVIARLIIVNGTRADRRVNIALISAFVCWVLRDRATHIALTWLTGWNVDKVLLYQLSEITVIPFAAALFLLCVTWLRSAEPPWLAASVWTAAGICMAVVLVLLRNADPTTAGAHGLHTGWAVIAASGSAWEAAAAITFHDSLNYAFSLTLMVLSLRELLGRPHGRRLAVCTGTTAIAVGAFVQTLLVTVATVEISRDHYLDFVLDLARTDRQAPTLYMFPFTVVAATPLVKRLAQRQGWDRTSRLRRRLGPLWTDLTTACPEIVHSPTTLLTIEDSRYLLHRTVIEIRDCMLILSRYTGIEALPERGELHADFELRHAVNLVLACRSRMDGCPPSANVSAQQSSAADLIEDARELSRLARKWPVARKLASEF